MSLYNIWEYSRVTGEEGPVGKCGCVTYFFAAMLLLHSFARNCSASRLFLWDSYLRARTQTEDSDLLLSSRSGS